MKPRYIGREVVAVCIMVAGLFCAAGCQQSPAFSRSVPASTFNQIAPGVTQAQWLTATFGEPVEKVEHGQNREYWRWLYRAEKQADGWVVYFYSTGVKAEDYAKYGSAGAEFKDGVLVKLNMVDPKAHFEGGWAAAGQVTAGNATLRSVR